jgi:hypothetical protein
VIANVPRAAGWVAALALVGCAGMAQHPVARSTPPPRLEAAHADPSPAPPPEPPAVAGAAPLGGNLAQGISRPPAHTQEIELDSLPVAHWKSVPNREGFRLMPRSNGYRFVVERPLFAEILISGASSREKLPRMGRTAWAAFTGSQFSRGEPPPCGPGHVGVVAARWAGFAQAGWTDDGVDVELADGDFHRATCNATTRLVARARARAIVPGFAYATRLKVDFGGESKDERLVVFLPYGQMISTSGDPDFSLDEGDAGPFTRLSLPIGPGGTASAAVRVSPKAVTMWRQLRAGQVAHEASDESSPSEDLLVALDAVWVGDKKTMTVSVALPKGKDPKGYGKAVMR